MRTARLSTSGGFEVSACACAIRELLAKVPISAVTKPAPPAQRSPRRDIEEPAGRQPHAPNNMSQPSDLVRLAALGVRCPSLAGLPCRRPMHKMPHIDKNWA